MGRWRKKPNSANSVDKGRFTLGISVWPNSYLMNSCPNYSPSKRGLSIKSGLKCRPQYLRLAGGRRAISRLKNLDHVAGMFGRGHRWPILPDPIHQLHHILIDVGFLHGPVLPDHMGQDVHPALALGDLPV